MQNKHCLICQKHQEGEIPAIFQGQHTKLFHYHTSIDHPTMYKGHLFVESNRHISTFAELNDDEALEFGWLMAQASRILKQMVSFEHLYSFTLGHLVNHLHMHLVPRYPGTPEEHWGGWKLHDWKEAPRLNQSEINAFSREFAGKIPRPSSTDY